MSYERNQIISLLYRIFQAEKYLWYNKKGEGKIPTHEEITNCLESLEIAAEKAGVVETGKLRVEYDKQTKIFDYYFNLGSS